MAQWNSRGGSRRYLAKATPQWTENRIVLGLTIGRRNMRAIGRAIEQLHNLALHALRLYLDTSEELVPRVECNLAHAREIEVWNLRLGIGASLRLRNERYSNANEYRRLDCHTVQYHHGRYQRHAH